MTDGDEEVLRDLFAASNERDFPRAMGHYAEDVELFVSRDALLEHGEFRGRDAVGRLFGDWYRTFEPGYHFEIEETRDLGGAILLVASHRGRGRASGAEVHGQSAYLYRFRGRKIARVELYRTRAEALKAAGLE